MSLDPRDEMENLRAEIRRHERLYYVLNAPEISDEEFDALMRRLADEYPDYDWAHNKGYPAPKHIAAVNRLGFTPFHRKSFHLKNQLSLDF